MPASNWRIRFVHSWISLSCPSNPVLSCPSNPVPLFHSSQCALLPQIGSIVTAPKSHIDLPGRVADQPDPERIMQNFLLRLPLICAEKNNAALQFQQMCARYGAPCHLFPRPLGGRLESRQMLRSSSETACQKLTRLQSNFDWHPWIPQGASAVVAQCAHSPLLPCIVQRDEGSKHNI